MGSRYVPSNDKTFESAPHGSVPYTMSLTVNVEMPFLIKSIACETHKLQISIFKNTATVKLVQNEVMNRDLKMTLQVQQKSEPAVQYEMLANGKDVATLLTFFPTLKYKTTGTELIIILDRQLKFYLFF